MAKIQIQKKDIWIDMTPMSDVMTLLLCFFMLTSTFLTPEPIQVTTPTSVSEVKIPESDVLNILVSPEGRIYVGTENKNNIQVRHHAQCHPDQALPRGCYDWCSPQQDG